ncbi:FG-GAP-like repeat-containing protein [Streptomyces roseolus]|uniref:FG-GAP-like repeat-containing protein n=1 Tax=Streptomyces roseolus TaxID=67358 RepID=UPI0037B80B1E
MSATLAVTGLAATVAPAALAADTAPYEVTIAPLTLPEFTPHASLAAVGTGVQLDGGEQTRWQDLGGDRRVSYSPLCGEQGDQFGYGDLVVCPDSDYGAFTVHDFRTGRTYSGSSDRGTWLPLVAGRYLVQGEKVADGVTLRLFGYGDDAPADREVPLPGAAGQPQVFAQDGEGALLGYYVAGTYTVALFDFTAGTVTPLRRPSSSGAAEYATLGKDRIVLGGAGGIHVLSRAEPTAPGHDVAMPEGAVAGIGESGLVGDWFISRIEEPGTYMGRLWAFPLPGGAPRELGAYVRSGTKVHAGPDGSLYTIGMTDSGLPGVQRVALGTDGAPRVDRALALGQPYSRESMTLSQGRLVAQTSDEGTDRRLQGYDLALAGTHAAAGRWSCDALRAAANCPHILPSATYPRWWTDTGDGRLVTLENVNRTGCTDCAVSVHVTTPGSGGATRSIVVPYATAITARTIVRASGRYVHFYARSGNGLRSIVADIETGAVLQDSANLDQSLWGRQLWTGNGTNGTVTAVDVRTGVTVATADLGTGCGAFTELAVTGRWIFRRCASDTGAVLVHDRERRHSVWTRVPRDAKPLLGDGFLAYAHSLGSSQLYVEDVRSGEAEERPVGQMAWYRDQYVGQGWTVDRFGGGVAFLDPWESVRVTGLGGVTSRLAAIDADTPAANLKAGVWKPRWWLSKPGASWSLALRHKVTGKAVRTLTGGEARGIVAPSWDGKDAAGKYVANGAYVWSLTVKPADGHGADLTASGSVAVSGAAAVWRDMAGDDGFGDLLAMDTAGAMSLYRGTGTGAVSARVTGSGTAFATTSLLVPVGDVNGDRCADVLARVGDQLRAYRPGCGKVVTASSPYTLIGSGWGQYDQLTSPGDVNGDGYVDLVARQASTGDMYFYAGTATHAVKARVRIAADWKLYKRVVGAGDLNGDGRGDLLGVDAAGVLWRYYGTATGGVTARAQVGGGWGTYSALVGVGDLSGDGRADLVARTTDGKLYRYASNGAGNFGGRVLIGSGGWNTFKALF